MTALRDRAEKVLQEIDYYYEERPEYQSHVDLIEASFREVENAAIERSMEFSRLMLIAHRKGKSFADFFVKHMSALKSGGQ